MKTQLLEAEVGVLGVGHHRYWAQFAGLLERMHAKQAQFIQRVQAYGVRVVDFGPGGRFPNAYTALDKIRQANLDLLFVDMVTYATSATFAPLIQGLDIPIVLVVLQPDMAMDYPHGSTFLQLTNDDFCSVPEFTNVAVRMGKRVPPIILGYADGDAVAEGEIAEWCRIAKVAARSQDRPHRADGARAGKHVRYAHRSGPDHAHVRLSRGPVRAGRDPEPLPPGGGGGDPAMEERILSFFSTPDPVSDAITGRLKAEDLRTAAKAAVALERFAGEKDLTGLAYYYEAEPGSEMRELVTNFAVGNSLLIAAGFPMCGEFDLKTCLGMLIMDRLEIGGSFAEFHPLDFKRGSVLVGHDGPHHLNIAAAKPVLRSLDVFHGKPGAGAGVEFKIQEGPLSMLSVSVNAQDGSSLSLPKGNRCKVISRRRGTPTPTATSNRICAPSCAAGWPKGHPPLRPGDRSSRRRRSEKIAEVLGIEAVFVAQD